MYHNQIEHNRKTSKPEDENICIKKKRFQILCVLPNENNQFDFLFFFLLNLLAVKFGFAFFLSTSFLSSAKQFLLNRTQSLIFTQKICAVCMCVIYKIVCADFFLSTWIFFFAWICFWKNNFVSFLQTFIISHRKYTHPLVFFRFSQQFPKYISLESGLFWFF